MRLGVFAGLFIVLLATSSAIGGKLEDAKESLAKAADACDALKEARELSDCYQSLTIDLLARAQKKISSGNGSAMSVTATSDLPSKSPKVIDASDLGVETHKWDGKVVQSKLRCFYADKNEYRCLSAAGTRVDFSRVLPNEAREKIESKCDTLQKAGSQNCAFTVQWVYDHFESQETGGLGKRTYIVAGDGLGFIVSK